MPAHARATLPSGDEEILGAVENSRTLQLFEQGPGAVAVSLAAVVGLWLTSGLSGSATTVWLLLACAVLALRLALVLAFRLRGVRRPGAWWNRLYCTGTLLSGGLFAAWAIAFFPAMDDASRLLGALVLGAMAGGAVAVLSVRRLLALGYGFLLLIPASAMLVITGGRNETVAGVLGALFFLTMVASVSATHQRITHALLYSFRNARLLRAAEQHERELEERNAALDEAHEQLQENNRQLEEKIAQRTAALQQMATQDPLTGLPNRRGISDRISALIDSGAHGFTLLFIDLDGFKEINDAMGHQTGDTVLCEVGRRLRAVAGDQGSAARWGGDEFLVLMQSAGGQGAAATAMASDLVRTLVAPIAIGESTLRINCCIGIAHAALAQASLDRLIRQADLAVYAAKEAGPGAIVEFDQSLADRVERSLRIRQHLTEALAEGGVGLRLVLQPIVSASDARVLGAECLLRWRHPQLGEVMPAEFVPVAERSGLMPGLGTFVLDEACRLLADMPESALAYMAVNVSVAQVLQEDFAAQVAATTRRHGIAPGRLLLELTESTFAQDSERVIRTLLALRELGVRWALDDFGTGYSSLAYLQQMPIQVLKIDQRFVADLDGSGARIVEASLSLAQAFGMKTVAEGVEQEHQWRRLQALGVTALQGYLFSRPLEAQDFHAFLRAGSGTQEGCAPEPSRMP